MEGALGVSLLRRKHGLRGAGPNAPRSRSGAVSAALDELRERGVHAAVGGIALPNAASIALHEKLGFKKIGQFVEIGRKLERWVDVGYWELILR